MSTKAFKRILWIVLDGMGYEHARRCVDAGRFVSLSRIAREGYLDACEPSTPGCQTPSALYTLFSGAEPGRSGIWGYQMPRPDRSGESMSGFHARPSGSHTIWADLGEAGHRYSVMNVAFRADPVWSGREPGLDFGYDGYRLWRWPHVYRLGGARQWIGHQGLDLEVTPTREGISIRKGQRFRCALRVGAGAMMELSRGARAWAYLVHRTLLIMSPLSCALVRGDAEIPGARESFLDANAFRISRGSAEMAVEDEMSPSREAMRRKVDLMVESIRRAPSRLFVGYFPVFDEFNHVYAHQLETGWPYGRVSELFSACAGLVDECLGRVMADATEDDAVVVSSDHGAAPYRSVLHVNELLAAEGLVRRTTGGYELAGSRAYYHPSDCGLVLAGHRTDRKAALDAIQGALARARTLHGADIGLLTEGMTPPHLAFLYPMGDAYFTGRPPRRGTAVLDPGDQGGHHLSSLSPTPWIRAMLGLWSPRPGVSFAGGAPRANHDVSRYLRALLDGEA